MPSNQDFDAASFLQGAVAQGANDTQFLVCPEGTYKAQIGDAEKFDAAQGVSEKGNSWTRVTIPWVILDDTVKAELGRETVLVYQDLFLDVDETGGLATGKGKNVNLGRLREATGLNDTTPFAIPMLANRIGIVKVYHDNSGDRPRARIKDVAPMT